MMNNKKVRPKLLITFLTILLSLLLELLFLVSLSFSLPLYLFLASLSFYHFLSTSSFSPPFLSLTSPLPLSRLPLFSHFLSTSSFSPPFLSLTSHLPPLSRLPHFLSLPLYPLFFVTLSLSYSPASPIFVSFQVIYTVPAKGR